MPGRFIKRLIFFLFVLSVGMTVFVFAQETNSKETKSLSFLSVNGTSIITEEGREIRFRGIQIDFGSARGDVQLGPSGNAELEKFLDGMMNYVVTEDDFRNIKTIGANIIRLSLNTYKDFESDTNFYSYREENFEKLDKVVDWAEKYNIYIIISMRQSPGGHNVSPDSGNDGLNKLWSNTEYQKRLISLWKKITARYSDRSVIAGYDLLNEPYAPNKEILNNVYREITKGIREIDNKHIIFLEGNSWGNDIGWIQPPFDANTALSIHFYIPGSYAVDGKGVYPSKIKGITFDKNMLREKLKERIAYAQELNRPVWVGEFGAMSKAGNYLQYDEDVIQLLEELNLNWTYWNYKNLKGRSGTQALYYTGKDYKFLRLISRIKSGRTLSSFTGQELKEAVDSLKTSNFSVNQYLQDLLMKSMRFVKE